MFDYQIDFLIKEICGKCDHWHGYGRPQCIDTCSFFRMVNEYVKKQEEK